MRSINSPKVISIICYSISIFIFLAIYLYGIFLPSGEEFGYCVLDFYMIMTLTSLIVAIIISTNRGYLFWLYPIFVGILGIIIPYLVFGTMDGISIFFAFVPALIGLAIVLFIRVLKTILNKNLDCNH